MSICTPVNARIKKQEKREKKKQREDCPVEGVDFVNIMTVCTCCDSKNLKLSVLELNPGKLDKVAGLLKRLLFVVVVILMC